MSSSIPQFQPPMSGPQIPVNYSIATGMVIGVDQYIAKPVVEDSELPDELKGIARGTLDVAALYGISKGTESLGLGGGWNWAKIFGAFPMLAGTQSIIGYAMHELGFDPNETKNEIARIALSIAPLYLTQHFPSVYSAMTASMSGIGLLPLSVASPAGGAGICGGLFQSISVLGMFIIANQIAGGVMYVGGHINELNYEVDYPLMKRSYDLLLYDHLKSLFGETGGAWFNGLLGNHIKIVQALASYASDNFENDLLEGIDIFRNRIIDVTRDITAKLEEFILDAILKSYSNDSFDWNIFSGLIRNYYLDNKDIMDSFYGLIEYTGFAVPSALELKRSIDINGYLGTKYEVQKYLESLINRKIKAEENEFMRESLALGILKVENGEVKGTNPEDYTEQQKKYLKENFALLNRHSLLKKIKL